MRGRPFPWQLHLALGVLSLLAAGMLVLRGVTVDWTTERIISGAVFAAFGILWLVAARLGRRA